MILSFPGRTTFDPAFVRVICWSKNKSSVNKRRHDLAFISFFSSQWKLLGWWRCFIEHLLKLKGGRRSLSSFKSKPMKAGDGLIRPLYEAVIRGCLRWARVKKDPCHEPSPRRGLPLNLPGLLLHARPSKRNETARRMSELHTTWNIPPFCRVKGCSCG